MLAFVTFSLLVTMSLSQTESFVRGSLQYWLVVVPAVVFPLLGLPDIVRTLFGRGKLLLILLLWAGGWHAAMGDARATVQLCATVLALTWISTDRAAINVQDLTRLYLLLLVVGLSVSAFSNFNRYGLIPGYSDPVYGLWRVSFFPNIAYTGALSLVMLVVLTHSKERARRHPVVLAIATYFFVLCFVRAALIAGLVYLVLYFFFCRNSAMRPARMFWIALAVAVGFNVAVVSSANILYALQDNVFVSTFLLRGETNLSVNDILYQLYRPWLWKAHLQLLYSSPAWMGWGSPEFYQSMLDASGPPLATIGSESLPTRLLASYGIAGLLFTLYLIQQLRRLAFRGDRWACACFPAVFILMMNWGGIFHPTDGMFALLLLPITRGSNGFLDDQTGSVVSLAAPAIPPKYAA
ncbi:hypothetical protein KMZ68_18955 [Bradyrhizobium sediminis]|uniref:O-antigen ligase domain-containing protein n=1 Tax=Bradyrhizobium sediminis TaxID=2840469 RepID=A0A975NM57_9BRAD|nr:hypothetical protein [Bradyrhizobium sediminis]QWG17046.1 hypothetical protein KMZ68_18955 [Bradyrhizobium sediminis]